MDRYSDPLTASPDRFVLHAEDDWEITLQPRKTACGWLHVFLSSPAGGGYSERYALSFNLMHRVVEANGDWDRLYATRRDMAMWFLEKMDFRLPCCDVCNEMWRREGCP